MIDVKKTKIVASINVDNATEELVEAMIKAGTNVFRINFSHCTGKYDKVENTVNIIRKTSEKLGVYVGILADLQGPKLRVGEMEAGVELKAGDMITFATGERFVGNKNRVYMKYDSFPQDVKKGERFLVDDGKLIFEVEHTDNEKEVKTRVIQGGILKSNKGVNLPNTKISLPALVQKDREDAVFAKGLGVDWFALSFVRHAKDIQDLKDLITEGDKYNLYYDTPIIAKIEKPEALENIDEIIANCSGIMVARGDLAVEIPSEKVPLWQKILIEKSKRARIPVIVATQMLDSMEESLTPKRAEVSDVANAILDGADAVMLSGETSAGKYPVESVATMSKIVSEVEASDMVRVFRELNLTKNPDRYVTKSACYSAVLMADNPKAKVISTLTNTGYTAFQVSAMRPKAHIIVFSSNKKILTKLSLLWGVTTHFHLYESTDVTVDAVNRKACKRGYIDGGDVIINLLAVPMHDKGYVNTIHISEIKNCDIYAD